MASVSISITVDQAETETPEDWTAGTSAPGAGAFEVRVDMAKFTSLRQIQIAVEKLETFLYDMNYGPNTFKVL